MNKVLTIVVFLLMSIGAWAGEVIIVKNPSNGGTVVASQAGLGETCTLTVTPADGNYLKSIKAVTTVSGNAIQAPRRAGTIDIDETELTITSNASADPSGETTHTFTMPEDGNLNVEVTVEFEARLSISDATITLAETSYTYDGTAKQPGVSSVVVDGTTLNANEYTVSYSNNTSVSTSATVTVTGQRAYTGTATTTFTISAKSITSDMITLTASSFVYCGETQTPGVTVMDGNTSLTENTDYTISYQVLDGETAVEAEDTRDVATYNVVVTGNGNYTGSATKSFAITKAQLEDLSVSLENWTYGATAKTPTVADNVGGGTPTYYYKVKDAADETYTAYPGTQTLNAGVYTIKVEVAETANYASGSATADFTIAKADIIPTVALTGWTYGATANTPVVTGKPDDAEVSYTYSVNTENPEEQEFTTTVPENAGSYIVKATVSETTNYNSGEATSTFTIAKADMSMVSVAYNDLDYNGAAQQLFTVNNVPENATVKYICQEISDPNQMICDPNEDMYSTTVPSATNAGYYGIIYKVEGTDNYNGTEASQTYCVQIVAATITEVTLDETSLPYNGANQTVTITSVKAGDLVLGADDYTVTLNGEVVTGNITAKDVDEYVVEVTGKGNFTGTESASFSIISRTLADNEVSFNNNWATFYSNDGDVMLPSGKTIGAYVATSVGEGVVNVSQISYIPEGVPVLLNNATETVATEAFDVEEGVNLLQHADEDIAVSDINGTVYGLYNGSMMRVSGTIPAGKNYLLVSNEVVGGGNAPQLSIVFDVESDITGISQIENEKLTNDIYYDLMGRKIQKPSKKGLYIQKGRVVVVDNK